MKTDKKNKDYTLFCLILILILAFILRIWKISELYYFGIDEEIMNLILRRIVLFEHIPLIGSFSPLGTYLGPYFYYFGSIILFLSNLNPIGQGFFSAILGTIATFFIYKVGKDFFGKTTGLISATIYSSSFLMVIFDRRYWHLTPGPLLSLLVIYSLYKIKNGSIKYIYLLTTALIAGWNTDYTNLILFLFVFITWIVFRLPFKTKHLLLALVIFILSNAPLIAFDLRHDYLNSKKFINYFTHKYQSQVTPKGEEKIINTKPPLQETRSEAGSQSFLLNFYTYSRLLYTNSKPDISLQQSYCKQYIEQRLSKQEGILLILAFMSIILFFWIVFKQDKKNSLPYKLILTFYLTFISGIIIYSFVFHGDVFEHYQATLLPIYVLIAAVVLSHFIKNPRLRSLIIAGLILWVIANINLVINAFNSLGFKHKQDAVSYALSKVGDQQFYLDSIGSCHSWDGYYYTFLLQGRHPDKSYLDDSYSWLYNYTPLDKKPKLGVVLVPKAKTEDQLFYNSYNYYSSLVKDRASFGDIEVLIVEEKTNENK